MIVRERPGSLVLIEQHEHARLSGHLAALWDRPQVWPALILAAGLHDVAWLPLDRAPRWNPQAGRPFSFLDYPMEEKLAAYRSGLDRVAAVDAYAGLLCSRHYASFVEATGDAQRAFLDGESHRQAELRAGLRGEIEREQQDLALLQLWDRLSLYVALNEPGVAKAEEHPWYREGFPPVPVEDGELRLRARWIDRTRVALEPFPLVRPTAFVLAYRELSLEGLDAARLAPTHREAPTLLQPVLFQPEPGG